MTGDLTADVAAAMLASFPGRRIVVVGDVFLDRYLIGRAERLSREGPVPVLAFERSLELPGGAANPARNLAALGADVVQVAVVGDDQEAERLREVLLSSGIDADGLVIDPSRPTTLKTRIVAEGLAVPQQVARIDRQVRTDVDPAVERRLAAAIADASRGAHALLVSHYRSGVVTEAVCGAAVGAARSSDALLTCDAQGDLARFRGFDLVRVGRQDAGVVLESVEGGATAEPEALDVLRRRLEVGVLVLGRGAEGMSVVDESGHVLVRPVNVSEVFDVAGAGDTVIAVFTLALSAGCASIDAARLASAAAGVVVRRLGVAAPTAAEIVAELDRVRRGS
jgi:rfaE bifunctional protein kinase chain/domain